jgi:putative glycosyltransferase (TIGR04372 family)
MSRLFLRCFARLCRVGAVCRIPARYFGHLATEPDTYLKEVAVGLREPVPGLVWIPGPGPVCNPALLRLWRRHPGLRVWTGPRLVRLAETLLAAGIVRLCEFGSTPKSDREPYPFVTAESKWRDRPPLLSVPRRLLDEGERFLREVGIPEGAWLVALHCRDSGHDASRAKGGVRAVALHSHRNVAVERYREAVGVAQAAGGWVVRLGDATMAPFPCEGNYFDYATSGRQADWLDLFLIARARFVLGSASGPANVANVLGTPVLWTNMAPFSTCRGIAVRDLGVPKLLREEESGRFLSFPEILAAPVSNFRKGQQYEALSPRLELVENSAQEIADATRDMLRFVERGALEGEDRELDEAFAALFRPWHLCYGAPGATAPSFLRRHREKLFAGAKANAG